MRFNSNGALDPTFGTAGISLVTPAPILGPQALALLSNGDYLAVGETEMGWSAQWWSSALQECCYPR